MLIAEVQLYPETGSEERLPGVPGVLACGLHGATSILERLRAFNRWTKGLARVVAVAIGIWIWLRSI